MMKKGLLTVFLAIAAVSLIMVSPSASLAQGKGPIKIGFISPLSGGMAANGKDMLTGIELYLEEIGYQAAGRKIEFLVEDDEANPATGLTKTRWSPSYDRGINGFDCLCPRALYRLQRNPHDLPNHVCR